jgi:hypothetical protein
MKTTMTQWAAKAAGAGAIALLLASPAVAQQRGDWNRGGNGAYGSNDSYRVRNDRDDHRFVRGVVERVDYRSGTIRLRDDASGRTIIADVNNRALRNLRRGDRVELAGQWNRGGVFNAERVESIRGRR